MNEVFVFIDGDGKEHRFDDSPENCVEYNANAKKATLAVMEKLEELLKKHGVKMIGAWIVPSEHLHFMVFDAPSLEAFNALGMEPEISAMGAFNTTEIKMAISAQEAIKMLRETK